MVQITQVIPKDQHKLEVKLTNGNSVTVDFSSRLNTVRFGLLADNDLFQQATTDGNVVRWNKHIELSLSEMVQMVRKDVPVINDYRKKGGKTMEEKMMQLKEVVESNPELVAKMLQEETPEGVQALLLREAQLDFTKEEIILMGDLLVKHMAGDSGELTDDELEQVAGGAVITGTTLGIIAGFTVLAAGGFAVAGAVEGAIRNRW